MHRIVVIHGLSWKPPKETLAERFRFHLERSLGRQLPPNAFRLAYWAKPSDAKEGAEKEEYTEPHGRFEPLEGHEALIKKAAVEAKSIALNTLDGLFGRFFERPETAEQAKISSATGKALGAASRILYDNLLEDIRRYLHGGERSAIKGTLIDELAEPAPDEKICLIAHSMGSMIATDVLASTDLRVDRLITIGSPLGISVVRRQLGLEEEAGKEKLKSNVGAWFNLYDPLDKIAFDHDLNDDFPEIAIADRRIENHFVTNKGERNHHKSYGYLQAPEMGQLLDEFLAS